MLILLLISTQFVTAFAEALRIRYAPANTQNISKKISVLIAVLALACVNLINWQLTGLHFLPWHVVLAFVFWRWLLYDPLLNIFRREKLDYTSHHTNSFKDRQLQRHGIYFWRQRAAAAACLLIYYTLIIVYATHN